jgi:hypothetical protein
MSLRSASVPCLREVGFGATFVALCARGDCGSMPAMSDKYGWPPYSFYAPPGVVKVSASALRMARELAEKVLIPPPRIPLVIVFGWRDSGWVRKPPNGPRVELGPGIDLAACEAADVPRGVLQTIDGVEFAVLIPRHIYENSALRLIDTDETEVSGLTLR